MSLYLALNKYQWEELERMIREARAEAWDEGARQGCMCQPPEVPNPYREGV